MSRYIFLFHHGDHLILLLWQRVKSFFCVFIYDRIKQIHVNMSPKLTKNPSNQLGIFLGRFGITQLGGKPLIFFLH